MVPSSTNDPSANRSTRESSAALSPATVSTRVRTPIGPSTADKVWLGAVLRARRWPGWPGTASPRPLNSSANTISRIDALRLEHDEPARQLTGRQRAERLVGLVPAVPARDELIDRELAGQVERAAGDQAHQHLTRTRRLQLELLDAEGLTRLVEDRRLHDASRGCERRTLRRCSGCEDRDSRR